MAVVKRGPRKTEDRLKRLLVMLPWLMENTPARLDEMALRFDLSSQALVADLELAAMCGLPPYLDECIDVYIDEGLVHMGVPRFFVRSLRLTAPEGFALLSSGRAAMALPGADTEGPLGRALDKLAAALGGDSVVIEIERPALVDALVGACESGARQRIVYWTLARDEAASREVAPRKVFTHDGFWYLVADDFRSGEERSFRIDRIIETEPTGESDPKRDVVLPDPERWFSDEASLPRATISLRADQLWMIDRYPTDSLSAVDSSGLITVVLAVTSEQWLARLLLRLGPTATVIAPDEWKDLGAREARRVLAGYAPIS